MTVISKMRTFLKLDDIIDKCNNTCHIPIKMDRIDIKLSTNFDFKVENNEEDLKSKVGNHVTISKYLKNLQKGINLIY